MSSGTSSAGVYVVRRPSARYLQLNTSCTFCFRSIYSVPDTQHGPELSFNVTGIRYEMEFVPTILNYFISGSCKLFTR